MIICQHLKLFGVIEKIVSITQMVLAQNIILLLLQRDVLVSQNGRHEKICRMGDVDEIYRDEEKRAYDTYIHEFLH